MTPLVVDFPPSLSHIWLVLQIIWIPVLIGIVFLALGRLLDRNIKEG